MVSLRRLSLLLIAIVLGLAVYFFISRPDKAAAEAQMRQDLAAEAQLRSQTLSQVLEKYSLAIALIARTESIRAAITREGFVESARTAANAQLILQETVSGAERVDVFHRSPQRSLRSANPPAELLDENAFAWDQLRSAAFGRRLGRYFYRGPNDHAFYAFLAPIFQGRQAPAAAVLLTVDLDGVRQDWEASRYRLQLVPLQGSGQRPPRNLLQNNPSRTAAGMSKQVAIPTLDATLVVTADRAITPSDWALRTGFAALALLLALLILDRVLGLAERRREQAEKLQELVTKRTAELDQAQTRVVAAEKLALLGQVSVSISHEINQPLATIKTRAASAKKLLARDQFDSAAENLSKIEALTERISRIMLNLRSYASKEPLEVKPVAIPPIIARATAELTDRFPSAATALTVRIPHTASQAFAGEVRLQQVLYNLLVNAWLALKGPEAEPSRPAKILVSLRARDEWLDLIVEDSGPGISLEKRAEVFEAFSSGREDSLGLGLGLTISKSFVETMDGTLTADRSELGGARLVISLRSVQQSAQ